MDFKENIFNSLPHNEAQLLLESLEKEDKHAVLLNTKFISDEDFIKLYPNVKKHPIVEHAYIYDKNEYQLGKSIYHELGYFYLQDPSAMVVSSIIQFLKGDIVLDLCAAPGGKTIQAAMKMNEDGIIISNDLSKSRAELISNNIERLGLNNVIITNNNFINCYNSFINSFDKIILDAPCSGSGMFRKDQKMIDDWSYNKVLKFSETQKELISIAYKMLKPGGILSYSTCSYSKEEDENIIHFLMNNSDAELIDISNYGFKNPIDPIGIRLMPSHFDGEGQYIALVKKPGHTNKTDLKRNANKINFLPECCKNKSIINFSNFYFMTDYLFNSKNLSVVRYGVKIGEYLKGVLHYDMHFARSITFEQFPSIELSLEEVKKYLAGNVINKCSKITGDVLLTYKNKPFDISRTNGLIIKNHYPKGLRKIFN